MVSAARGPRSRDEVFEILAGVPDPEVPAISVVDLGIVRDAEIAANGAVTVTITPTYSGCPAMFEIEKDVIAALEERGAPRVEVRTVLSPAWTTDWIGADAREKLRKYGIAPPGRAESAGLVTLARARAAVPCPWCGSHDTELKSEFGSTACKAIHVCRACKQPFDEFKAF